MSDKSDHLAAFDFQRFVFPIEHPLPLRIPTTESTSGSEDEFVSVDSSVGLSCSSDFTNPYGIRCETQAPSEASSDREFGTARDYHGFESFDMQDDLFWHNSTDEADVMPPSYGGQDFSSCPSEDKYVMTSDAGKQSGNLLLNNSMGDFPSSSNINYSNKQCVYTSTSTDIVSEVHVTDYYHLNQKIGPGEKVKGESKSHASILHCEFCAAVEGSYDGRCAVCSDPKLKETDQNINNCQLKVAAEDLSDFDSLSKHRINNTSSESSVGEIKGTLDLNIQDVEKISQLKGNGDYDHECDKDVVGRSLELDTNANEQVNVAADGLPICNNFEDEYEVFDLRIIHRKNRTGFEENKDFAIVINSIIAGRYCVTEYLGSAAFSKVVQAHDFHTGVNVCLKIIKNDKDFFDQSLDEIKLLKFVNKHDPNDERHILRLFDYFYYQEHLFIVCELLRANLYEFQKFNQETAREVYFTMGRLQVIARQCLEALEFLHHLGIIHCDLKPENILIKSYRRCEIKVIDFGNSCFQTDNLCLYVQSRSYRAPEVILGLPYDPKIDIWSLGCILAELCTGEVLFPNEALAMLLARMIGMIGPIDLEMLVKGQEAHKYFTKEYDLYHINEETDQLEYIIPEATSLEDYLQVTDMGFVSFLRDLLEVNPRRRPTAREALDHPWFSFPYHS